MIRLLFALALAAPTIASVTPSSSPVAGGVRVVIRGTGFSNNCINCSPPFAPPAVYFGDEPAEGVTFIDSTTLEVVTPPHLPGTVNIRVTNRDLSGTAEFAGFAFTGEMRDAFEPLLFPIFLPPIRGAFGSEFRTTARVFPLGTSVLLYGQDTRCYLIDPPFGPEVPISVTQEAILLPDCNRTAGRILWTFKGAASSLAANIRVADISREATSFGTEIPVVRQHEFTTGAIALLGVPTDPRFRVTLRIYSLGQTSGQVHIDGYNRQVFLTPARDEWEPSYAEIGDLPRTLTRVYIHPTGLPLWAFITVTNNETGQITTITPQ